MGDLDRFFDGKNFFARIVKRWDADCILDVGSRDGDQSLFFRDLAPKAHVAAFEANPANYQIIVAKHLEKRGIEVYPYAATNENGKATFYVADPASDPHAYGSSSLLPGAYPLKEKIEVETRRLDDFILEHYPDAKRIALWIDVESAEYEVLEGISKIKDRIIIIHTETAREPIRENQKVYPQLSELLTSAGFVFCGTTMGKGAQIGDVVFVNGKTKSEKGFSFTLSLYQAHMMAWVPTGPVAVFLRNKFPAAYRLLRKMYIRLGT